jgi:hypothetical protein
MKGRSTELRAGEWVEVKSKDEILKTLDASGQVDSLPFMPEMLRYSGQRVRVYKRAHKTCDPARTLAGRGMDNTVHLEGIRCDGSAHGGCQAGCLIFWKDTWLSPSKGSENAPDHARRPIGASAAGCTEQDVWAAALQHDSQSGAEDATYVCQATNLSPATTPLQWWDPRQYFEDIASGNVKPSAMVAAFLFFICHTLATAGLGFGTAIRWTYDTFQRMRGGTPYPWREGRIPAGRRTPVLELKLKPGDLVQVKSYSEILDTLDENWRNRGMYFDGEMVPYCGGTFRVSNRVERIIDEKTGRMLQLKSDAIVLDDVICRARYAECRRFCPRSIYPYWREIWLERVQPESSAKA